MSDAVSTSVCAEICGSTVIFLCFHKILFLGKGSCSNTSRTACLILPLFKCLIKSFRLASWSFLYAIISQVSYLVTVSIATTAAVKFEVTPFLPSVSSRPGMACQLSFRPGATTRFW